ncbi:MAG: methyltransferase family protein [Vicinamibacterales bacterium]
MKRTLATAARIPGGAGSVGVDVGLLAPPARARGAERPRMEMGDLAARVAIVVSFSFLAFRLANHFMQTGHLTGLMLLASEALVVVLTVFRRATVVVDRSARARVLTTVSLIGPLVLIPVIGRAVLPESVTATFSACGLLIIIVGKMSLGRSFGLMPANRGVVSTGLYRLVRHPIYMGYLITHVGFLFANPTLWNVLTLAAADLALLMRAVSEERVLARDAAYRAYLQRVRWRVAPGLF